MKPTLKQTPNQTLSNSSLPNLTKQPKLRRETVLLYGAWTILTISIFTMIFPVSNSHRFSESEFFETVEIETESGFRTSR